MKKGILIRSRTHLELISCPDKELIEEVERRIDEVDLSKATIPELIEELGQRLSTTHIPNDKLPPVLDTVDWAGVVTMAEEHIEVLAGEGHAEDPRTPQYVYEAVMKAVYGKDIFNWINNRLK